MTPLDPLDFLANMDGSAMLSMFWFLLVLDIPRYTLAFIATAVAEVVGRRVPAIGPYEPRVSIILAGHNERDSIRRCVMSLHEQTYRNIEIVCVDDGSTDGMSQELRKLRAEGLIDTALFTSLRCGKSPACNLALSRSANPIVVNIDIDCTLDRDAIARIVAQFADPAVGAVSGNIGVRNADASVIAALQAIEYLMTIALGKRSLDFLDIVTCASGAFSAFRRQALEAIGGLDVGPGEDLDVTLRLRKAGWTIRFAPEAWCLTDVPVTLSAFIRQRMRWERDTIRLRLRKHRDIFDPRRERFSWIEIGQQLDFILTNLIVTFIFPFYLIWLFYYFDTYTWLVLAVVGVVYIVLDTVAFIVAIAVVGLPGNAGVGWLIPIYGLFNAFLMRTVRICAYTQEWIFRSSYRDSYVPAHVLRRAPWF